MAELIGMKDDKLKKRAKVLGEQLKPLAKAMLKRQVDQHNDILKLKELVEAMMKDMKDGYPIEKVTEALAKQMGAGVAMLIKAVNAIGETDSVTAGALNKLKGWSKDLQNLGDPKIDFGVKPQSRIIKPKGGIITPNLKLVKKSR